MALAPQAASQIGNSQFVIFDQFEKMHTNGARQTLPAKQVSWIENLQPIAANDLQAVPGPAASLTTLAGKTVSRSFPANIGATDYIIEFNTDGSAIAVNANTGAQTVIATAGKFSTTPDMTVYSSARILIMDATSGYATWNGTLFVGSGGVSPNINVTGGSGYTSAPAVSFTGGAGGNAGRAAATAVISGGSVVAINLTNPGAGNAAGAAITVVLTGGGFAVAATATARVF